MLRAENEGFIKFKVEVDIDEAYEIIDKLVLKGQNATTPHVQLAIENSYKRLLNPSFSARSIANNLCEGALVNGSDQSKY